METTLKVSSAATNHTETFAFSDAENEVDVPGLKPSVQRRAVPSCTHKREAGKVEREPQGTYSTISI
jgi:hypothetical protein